MSMSTHVVGFRPPDEKFRKMRAAWNACKAAKVDVPADVWKFFDETAPDEAGVRINLRDKKYADAVYEYHEEDGSGFEIDLEKLPKDIRVIRVVNSW